MSTHFKMAIFGFHNAKMPIASFVYMHNNKKKSVCHVLIFRQVSNANVWRMIETELIFFYHSRPNKTKSESCSEQKIKQIQTDNLSFASHTHYAWLGRKSIQLIFNCAVRAPASIGAVFWFQFRHNFREYRLRE